MRSIRRRRVRDRPRADLGWTDRAHAVASTACGEPDDPVDDLVEGVRRRVDLDGAVGAHQRRGRAAGVDPVAAEQGLLGGRDVAATLLGGAALGAGRRVGDQEDLDLRVGRHHRADVAALDHDAALADDRALELEQPGPHGGDGADRADRGVDLVGADRQGDVDAVDHDRRALRVGADQDLRVEHPRGHRVGVVDVDVVPQQPPGHGAEHGAGVEVAQSQPGRHPA